MELGWSTEVLLLALGGALFNALYSSNDNFILHKKITHPTDSFTPIYFYMVIGSWVGTICLLIYNPLFGRFIEPNYNGFEFGSWQAQKNAIVSGSLGAVSTIFYLWGNKKLDPSLVLGLSSSTVLFLAVYDSIEERLSLQTIIIPALLLVIGAGLTSMKQIKGGVKFTFIGLFVLLVGRCSVDTAEAIFRQIGGNQMDAINFCFWRFVWQSLVLTLIVVAISSITGKIKIVLYHRKQLKSAMLWIVITMFFVFLSNTLFQKAMQTGLISKTQLVMNFRIALGIPITLIANRVYPGIFGDNLPKQKSVWLIRFLGVLLIIVSIAFLIK